MIVGRWAKYKIWNGARCYEEAVRIRAIAMSNDSIERGAWFVLVEHPISGGFMSKQAEYLTAISEGEADRLLKLMRKRRAPRRG